MRDAESTGCGLLWTKWSVRQRSLGVSCIRVSWIVKLSAALYKLKLPSPSPAPPHACALSVAVLCRQPCTTHYCQTNGHAAAPSARHKDVIAGSNPHGSNSPALDACTACPPPLPAAVARVARHRATRRLCVCCKNRAAGSSLRLAAAAAPWEPPLRGNLPVDRVRAAQDEQERLQSKQKLRSDVRLAPPLRQKTAHRCVLGGHGKLTQQTLRHEVVTRRHVVCTPFRLHTGRLRPSADARERRPARAASSGSASVSRCCSR